VLIRREAHAIAVAPAVRQVGEPSDGEQIVGVEQRERVVARQPFTALDLVRDGSECGPSVHHARPPDGERHVVPAEPEGIRERHVDVSLHGLVGRRVEVAGGSGVNWLMVGG